MLSLPSNVPNGIAFECAGELYMRQAGKTYKFASERAFRSWHVPLRLLDSRRTVESTGTLGFRAGSLLQGFADARLYLVADNLLRPIVDPDVWKKYGFSWDEVIVVSKRELAIHELGEELGI